MSDESARRAQSREVARRIGVHVMARARKAAVGRIDLAPLPGGFGTPAFGPDHRVIRLSGDLMVVETTSSATASTRHLNVNGATLRDLAALADVGLDTELDVGHDTPSLGDVDEPLRLNGPDIVHFGDWWGLGLQVIDAVLAALPATAAPTRTRLWPEHFDLGVDLAAADGSRLNLGASPGDDFHDDPYLYVAPWESARPGPAPYWNAPFGAILGQHPDLTPGEAIAFLTDGIDRFS